MQNLTIITLNQPNIKNFTAARNAELAKVKTKWVLFIDSDETVTKELKEEIELAIENNDYEAYYLRRIDNFLGRELRHGETGNAHFIRLAKKDFGQWTRPVHEVWSPVGAKRGLSVKIGVLKNPIMHNSHPTIASFMDKINKYSTLEAEYRFAQGIRSNMFKIAIYPFAKFKLNYFLRLGFLDGVPGTIMAIMMSFHSYLTWTKLYLLWHKK